MNFKVNPSLFFGAVFTVPTAVTDKYLKLADSEQLKALLWVLRHASEDVDIKDLCSVLKCEAGDAEDYLSFWTENGILIKDGETNESVSADKPKKPKPEPEQKYQPLPVVKPTSEQILQRIKESEEIRFLFDESQKKLARTLGYDGQSTILMLHDQYGLPVEVIITMIEYCSSVGKTNSSYIAAVGKDWAEREIDTIEKADKQISVLQSCNGLWKQLSSMAGIDNPRPTAAQSEYLKTWKYDLGFDIDMIYLAYEEMANHCSKLSFAYMNKILNTWHNDGIKTPEEVIEAKQKRADKTKKSEKNETNEASYNMDKFKRDAMYGHLVYNKKKKSDDKK
ncbi:MAG: DnaD domain protein [Clostridiales bacterium]|nr:DnaD domain protein [Clostridiales bacterium]